MGFLKERKMSIRTMKIGRLPGDMQRLLKLLAIDSRNKASRKDEASFRKIELPVGILPLSAFPQEQAGMADADDEKLQEYANTPMEDFPPIVIAHGYWIDGRHRVWAAGEQGAAVIKVIDASSIVGEAFVKTIGFLGPVRLPGKKGRLAGIELPETLTPKRILGRAEYAFEEVDRFLEDLGEGMIEQAWLYGSIPQGRATAKSDIDLALVGDGLDAAQAEREEMWNDGRFSRHSILNLDVPTSDRPGHLDVNLNTKPPPGPRVLLYDANRETPWMSEEELAEELRKLKNLPR